MLEHFRANNDRRSVTALEEFNGLEKATDVFRFHNSVFRDKAMHKLGIGTMRNMHSVFSDIFIPVWTCRAYTLREKWNIWKSKLSFLPKTKLKSEILNTDFTQVVNKIDIPVYFAAGKYDLTVNIDLQKDYFGKLAAPIKGFYTFGHSAHSPLFEEPELFREILENDVLRLKVVN